MHVSFIDVETPNKHNDRICSVGVVVTDERGNVEERKHFLVDPECQFDDVNIRIHGITPIDVKGAKTFPELWESDLSSLVPLDGIVAHNAPFDLSVVSKTMRSYGIVAPKAYYECTMRMAKATPGISSVRLPDVCAELGIKGLKHHKAESDADACMKVFWRIVDMHQGILPDFHLYVPRAQCTAERCEKKQENTYKTRLLQRLKPVLENAVSDGEVSIGEAMDILDAISSHEMLAQDPSIGKIADALQGAVSDGFVSKEESARLTDLISGITDPVSCGLSEPIEYSGSNFVLTGNFEHGSKSQIGEMITSRGGVVQSNVTKKTNYVVIGGCGSDDYALGNYGTKVKKALDWMAKGMPIKIAKESDLYRD